MANNGRFIFAVREYKNHSFEKGTLNALPTSWSKLGNGNNASTFLKNDAVAGMTISGHGAGTFVGKLTLAGTDTEMYAYPTTNPTVELNKGYILVCYLRTAGGTGSGKIGIAGVDGGGTVQDAETFTDFTAGLLSSAWTKIELKKTFTDVDTTAARVRIYHSTAANVLYADHTFFGKVVDLVAGGTEPPKAINKFNDKEFDEATALATNDETFELVKIAEPLRQVKMSVNNIYYAMAIHTPIVDMVQNDLQKAKPVAFWFDKDDVATRHYLMAGKVKKGLEPQQGIARDDLDLDLDVLAWKGYF